METSWTETERRQHDCYHLMFEAAVTTSDESFAAVIFYISAGGAKMHLKDAWNAAENAMPKTGVLEIPEYGGFEGDIVWIEDDFIGINFHENYKTTVKLITGQSALTAV